MRYQKPFPFLRVCLPGLAILSLILSAFALPQQSTSVKKRSRLGFQPPAIGLEVTSPHTATSLFKGSSSSEGLFDGVFEEDFDSGGVEKGGLTLKLILFDDRTYEGDAKAATRYFARWEGEAVQAAKLLLLIEQIARVTDAELPELFDKLESGLWKMQEAMDKASAIEYLKIKYSNFDDATIAMLYEEFKRGFYLARNRAIYRLEQTRKRLQSEGERYAEADRIRMMRKSLSEAKNQLERLTSSGRGR